MLEIIERVLTGYIFGALTATLVIGLGCTIVAYAKHVKTCTKC